MSNLMRIHHISIVDQIKPTIIIIFLVFLVENSTLFLVVEFNIIWIAFDEQINVGFVLPVKQLSGPWLFIGLNTISNLLSPRNCYFCMGEILHFFSYFLSIKFFFIQKNMLLSAINIWSSADLLKPGFLVVRTKWMIWF